MKLLKYFASIPQFIIQLFNGLWNLCVSGVTGEGKACLKHPVLANCFQWKIAAGNVEASSTSALGPRNPDHPPFITHLFIFFVNSSVLVQVLSSSSSLIFAFHSYLFIESNSPVLWWILLTSPTPTAALLFLLAASRSWQQSNLDETIAFRNALLDFFHAGREFQ